MEDIKVNDVLIKVNVRKLKTVYLLLLSKNLPSTGHPPTQLAKPSFSLLGGGLIFSAGHLISENLSVVKLFLVYHSASFCSFLCVSLLGAFIFLSDLLSIEHHTPTPEKVTYDKTDGQWYTHDGVDVKETQQRLGEKGQ